MPICDIIVATLCIPAMFTSSNFISTSVARHATVANLYGRVELQYGSDMIVIPPKIFNTKICSKGGCITAEKKCAIDNRDYHCTYNIATFPNGRPVVVTMISPSQLYAKKQEELFSIVMSDTLKPVSFSSIKWK